ncbi:hypothetical protein AcW1_006228 [Taiwanofungus camphoratus]|nr:hypothetical protein AcW2_004986 [Antrodia cinnamomea]KAI0934837.1 hypothetical protein AcV5_006546 [Antrodia cinnamomea]KAI0949880.1 hypothetical protein AcV7_008520 [Antrodia cinnamomea]KAI0958034.1 hypothetical protein AcW1_006228 [Antrodia cinnamomea]
MSFIFSLTALSRPVRRVPRLPLPRTYSTTTELPRPPPKESPPTETFSSTAKPRQYYARPQRDLPPVPRIWPAILAFGTVGVGAWGAFFMYAANQEKLSSSVVCRIMDTVRASPELQEVLGDAIRFEPVWWLNGSPWIHGAIYLMQGNVDLSFRLKGHKGAGTLYFTSIRKAKGQPFTVLRFKVIADNGKVVNIPVTPTVS